MRKFNVAIDGPAGAGKSTVARLTAERLHLQYLDTGAMYRAVTWYVLQQGVPTEHSEEIAQLAKALDIQMRPSPSGMLIWVNGRELTDEIRADRVTSNVSAIASIPALRKVMVAKQQELAKQGGIVMDGRDTGTVVLPDAQVKVFLTASIAERARRRFDEMQTKGMAADFTVLKQEMERRDELDSSRAASPLKKAADAVLIDTTGLSIHEVVDAIVKLYRTKRYEDA